MYRPCRTLVLSLLLLAAALPGRGAEPDYSAWTALLQKYYSSQHGMNYTALKKDEAATLTRLMDDLAKVDVAGLSRAEQLAFWINLYNIATVRLVCDNYPTKSIRDLSTDPLRRLNVFDRKFVRQEKATLSLNDIENVKIREGFRDPRIHFAINCAARSCPPMRQEALTGARVDAQLDEQARAFINSTAGSKVSKSGGKATLTLSKVMDWFDDDFNAWGGGIVTFTKKYLAPEKRALLEGAKVSVGWFDYNWALNDWKR